MSQIRLYNGKVGRKPQRQVTINQNEKFEKRIREIGDGFTIIKQKYEYIPRITLLEFAIKVSEEFHIHLKYESKRKKVGILIWIYENYEVVAPHLDSLISSSSSPNVGVISETTKPGDKKDNNEYSSNIYNEADDSEFQEFYDIF